MGRPREDSLKYFSLQCDFFSDRGIRVLKGRYGTDGIALYIYILCECYRGFGYYLINDEDFLCIASDDLNMSIDKIEQIMAFLAGRSMLVELPGILSSPDATIITSRGIQKQYQKSAKGLRRDVFVDAKIWILEKRDTESYVKFDLNSINPEKTDVNTGLTEVNTGKTAQKKIKEKKVNESKEKEKKWSPNGSDYFSDPELIELFNDFLEVRKKNKQPQTERAINSLVKKLNAWPDDEKKIALENAIESGWRSVFPVKKDQKAQQKKADNGNPFEEFI